MPFTSIAPTAVVTRRGRPKAILAPEVRAEIDAVVGILNGGNAAQSDSMFVSVTAATKAGRAYVAKLKRYAPEAPAGMAYGALIVPVGNDFTFALRISKAVTRKDSDDATEAEDTVAVAVTGSEEEVADDSAVDAGAEDPEIAEVAAPRPRRRN